MGQVDGKIVRVTSIGLDADKGGWVT